MSLCRRGVTLIETAVAIIVIAVCTLGALSYQYHSARQMRIAHCELAATRIGQMVIEDWKAAGGNGSYDPLSMDIGFAKNVIGSGYNLAIDGTRYYVTLDSSQVDFDDFSGTILREIVCKVDWLADGGTGTPGSGDPSVIFTTYLRSGQD
jgi:prepilin-type N-terminal cleavage/methylation domain-containing protein